MFTRGISRRELLKSSVQIGMSAGWFASPVFAQEGEATSTDPDPGLQALIQQWAEPLPPIEDPNFARFIDRHRGAKVVLLGESTHGTDEFYRARAAITERLVREHGFNIVAVEADWPDAARIDAWIRNYADLPAAVTPFQRFPIWMWRNRAVRDLVDRLHAINARRDAPDDKVGFFGLDLYSLPSSMDAVMDFAKHHDPETLKDVQERYGCLAPYKDNLQAYGATARQGGPESCAEETLSVVDELLKERLGSVEANDLALFHAIQNARVVAGSEAYYRAMYEGSAASWNRRDTHMFETLKALFEARGPGARAVVWAHNSHIGDAAATDMGAQGEINIGHLCRREYGEQAVLVGFGTDRGTVTAASDWGGPPETKGVRPSLPDSWGAQMREAGHERFVLDLRAARDSGKALHQHKPERFIGVIYRPESERLSHYAGASLAKQFDAYVWIETTRAIELLSPEDVQGLPPEHPFSA